MNEGGTRSSKTYSLCQVMLIKALEKRRVISIVRKTSPALRATAFRDMIEVLSVNDLIGSCHINKTEMYIEISGSLIEFLSIDQFQKVKGRKRHILWCNEANELEYGDWRQLIMRTSEDIYLDYNPSDELHWIYDFVLNRDDVEIIKSSYLDNPFLELEIVKEIERMRDEDEEYWKIYGLGERARSANKIYTNWDIYREDPEGEKVYGLDFGYNHPTSLVQVIEYDGAFYIKSLIHESYLVNSARIARANDLKISKEIPLYPDIGEKASVEEWRQAGYNMSSTDKSVKDGIDFVKRHKLYIHVESLKLIEEIKSYCWKTKDGKNTDEPVKIKDDGMDSVRYPIYSHFANKTSKFGFI